ncbi:uncharacterized protein C8A04DRAFT_9069 [Dichotomopilus funicola]|uniref:ABC transporter domain-containing protein n=1 Tax=Dichotomopilus funicola TaxID=1934379 RepID=A0AAN6ZRK7_9PEZI|nr:hypothetical protein C8A04DRAFT_9069 [Dichotomopilus funicola]
MLLHQTITLTLKNLRLLLIRHPLATTLRALILPIIITAFLSFARNLFVPAARFGITSPAHPVRSLADALSIAGPGSGRENVVFVDGGMKGGEVEKVIGELVRQVEGVEGVKAWRVDSEEEVAGVCRASLRGVTGCFGAVVFHGSPDEGSQGGVWNYTLKMDASLGVGKIDVESDRNDAQVYLLPLQRAVDRAISRYSASAGEGNGGSGSGMTPLGDDEEEYPFTSLTVEERADRVRVIYQSMVMNFLGVTFVVAVVGIAYHLAGFMATERESGMATLIEAMTAPAQGIGAWKPQAARLLAYHLSFSAVYLPGWVVSALILWSGVFAHTNAAVLVLYFVLSGLAMGSMAMLGASFFRKSQLSGVLVTIVCLLLAIIAQTISWPKTGAVVALSLLFAPCNFTYFISLLARWEQQQWPADLAVSPPNSPWSLPGVVFFVFLGAQVVVYPVLAAFVERWLHGSASGRTVMEQAHEHEPEQGEGDYAVKLDEFTKIYPPSLGQRLLSRLFSLFSRSSSYQPTPPVVAVDKLTLQAPRGQIVALLGANGSGKSTTLDTIAGINRATSGRITVNSTGGLGIAPQKNVLWDELTVTEHLRIFTQLKTPPQARKSKATTEQDILSLVEAIDLTPKAHALSKTLSGGQKRKLQLGMMLAGGSAVCCVDEVSSGLDPLSRRKIWDILLAERGKRTMVLTTHFLDEADLLADSIAVLSRGRLRAVGTSAELKGRFGGGYRIWVNRLDHDNNNNIDRDSGEIPEIQDEIPKGVRTRMEGEETVYVADSSDQAAGVIRALETAGIADYRVSGPTMEDVFLQLAEEARVEMDKETASEKETESEREKGDTEKDKGVELTSGRPLGFWRQVWVLFNKRCVVFRRQSFPSLAAFVIPIVAAGLVMLFVRNQPALGCAPSEQSSQRPAVSLSNLFDNDFELFLVGGPPDKFSEENLLRLFGPLYSGASNKLSARATTPTDLFKNLTLVDSLSDFHDAVVHYRKNITPAALWLGDAHSPPTLAYQSGTGAEMLNAWFGQWALDMLRTNASIAASYAVFDTPWAPDAGKSLQLLVYISLALSAATAFFSLYPTRERHTRVRALQYSNGARPFPLWLAYTGFDFFVVVLPSAVVAIALLAGLAPGLWYHVGYVFLIWILFGLASVLLAYNVSLVAPNQLSAYAITAAGQVIAMLLYLIAYLCVILYAPVHRIDSLLVVVHFVVSVIAPITSVVRALFVALNLFSTACDDRVLSANPGGMLLYGGPVVYLIVQTLLLFVLLVWAEGGFRLQRSSRHSPEQDEEDATAPTSPDDNDGLRVVNLTKTFGSHTAVDHVSFTVPRGQVFALLGPNGAGKSTTISMIRGDLSPSKSQSSGTHNHKKQKGDIYINTHSITHSPPLARSHLGVCPQFDALDPLSVTEHLHFYAHIRGLPPASVPANIVSVLRAVGLTPFRERLAHTLSGGNKRKLSLAIALLGNPAVLVLDEPSSGLDAAAKRVMWRTLRGQVNGEGVGEGAGGRGRSVLLTTHSMEEADALAGKGKVGILAGRMLAVGGVEELRSRYGGGERVYVHLVCKGAPRTSEEEVARVKEWVLAVWPGAEVEEKTYHGQMRFWVDAGPGPATGTGTGTDTGSDTETDTMAPSAAEEIQGGPKTTKTSIGPIVLLLEANKHRLGIEHYSVSPATLDQVFLTVVGEHNVREEGYQEVKKRGWWRWRR